MHPFDPFGRSLAGAVMMGRRRRRGSNKGFGSGGVERSTVSDPPRPFTVDTERRGRGVQIALAVLGVPFVVSLAGLALRSPLADLAWLDEGPLALGAAASGAALLLVVTGAWAVDSWTVRRQLRALDAVNREIEATGSRIDTERARHAVELKAATTAIDAPSPRTPNADLDLQRAGGGGSADPLPLADAPLDPGSEVLDAAPGASGAPERQS